MKTLPFGTIYQGIMGLRGLDVGTANLTNSQRVQIADLVNERLEEGWTAAWWLEAMVVERRQYRASWAVGTTYGLGEEVYYDPSGGAGTGEAYYVSLQAGNVGHTPGDALSATWWEEVGDGFVRSIAMDQAWEANVIGDVDVQECLYDRDPRVYPGTVPMSDIEVLGGDIIVRTETAPARPWLRYRMLAPLMSLQEWDGSVDYEKGEACYVSSDRKCYRALADNANVTPGTNSAVWVEEGFPKFLSIYIKHAVCADLMQEDEGRYKERARAQEVLEAEIDRRVIGTGSASRVVYRGR